ncbi:response regulator transcription factor [Cryptosporangium aurantiacum]|uniref:Response regulator receiver domain-containing protein n=1 Tax=Cryptosporangium aurantiacum TaxID=134849 RepID=A0A1M7HSR9_9ACTN|nr:response regulator [Cryptosporangium aurantiacum]SHM31556.1 Response regulator receiver domain-containing protein [Cryptosporangium aurantiacum]
MSTILVADDDRDILDLVAFKLSAAGHELITATDGASALTEARRAVPDIVVLDVAMPGMSGLDVCRELRADAITTAIPVILLTARGQESDVEAGFNVGADDYIVKPFSPRELQSRVTALLSRART